MRPAARLRGTPALPGDKSISHRALLLAALANGQSVIRGAGDGADVRTTARLVGQLGAVVERGRPAGRPGRLPDRVAGDRRTPRGGSDPRLRQLGDDHPADRGDPGRTARLSRPRRRRFVAPAPARSYHRATARDGRRGPCAAGQFAPADDRGRPHSPQGDRCPDGRAERPGEVGDPAGRVAGRGSDDGPRSRWRPGTTPSGCSGRVGSRWSARQAGMAKWRSVWRAGFRVQAVSEVVPADPSAAAFWLVAGAIHPDAELPSAVGRGQPDPPGRDRHPDPDGRPDR